MLFTEATKLSFLRNEWAICIADWGENKSRFEMERFSIFNPPKHVWPVTRKSRRSRTTCSRVWRQTEGHIIVRVILSKCQFFAQQLQIDKHTQTSIRGNTEGQWPAARLWITAEPITVGTHQTSRQDYFVLTKYIIVDEIYIALFWPLKDVYNTNLQQTDLLAVWL